MFKLPQLVAGQLKKESSLPSLWLVPSARALFSRPVCFLRWPGRVRRSSPLPPGLSGPVGIRVVPVFDRGRFKNNLYWRTTMPSVWRWES